MDNLSTLYGLAQAIEPLSNLALVYYAIVIFRLEKRVTKLEIFGQLWDDRFSNKKSE